VYLVMRPVPFATGLTDLPQGCLDFGQLAGLAKGAICHPLAPTLATTAPQYRSPPALDSPNLPARLGLDQIPESACHAPVS